MVSRSKEEGSAPWRPRKYVLVGMGVIFAASALTMVTSIILHPAHVSFYASDFSYETDTGDRQQGQRFTFNLTSCNPSSIRRAGVMYHFVSVSVQLQRNGVRKTSVPANVTDGEWRHPQGSHSESRMRVNAFLDNQFYGFYSEKASATITVFAQARFKVGLVPTRLYNIKVVCERINLPKLIANGTAIVFETDKHSRVANCSAA